MRAFEFIVENMRGKLSPEQARDIGDCTIIAMSEATGLSWDEVWAAAKPRFDRYGLNSGEVWGTLRDLGFNMETYRGGGWMIPGTTVQKMEQWLRENDPHVRLICQIIAHRIPHSIAFADGKFHNVQGAYKAKVRGVSVITRA